MSFPQFPTIWCRFKNVQELIVKSAKIMFHLQIFPIDCCEGIFPKDFIPKFWHFCLEMMSTLCCISLGRCFGVENQINHQNFKKSLLSYECGIIFWKKESKRPTQKTEIFNSPNSQCFFMKVSWIGRWVSHVWAYGQQPDRLSQINAVSIN